jgi:hypothetical protein
MDERMTRPPGAAARGSGSDLSAQVSMRHPLIVGWPVILCLLSVFPGEAPGSAARTRAITFEERVRAQEAIERVYYAHQLGATRPFEEAVSREVIEGKVRDYLRMTVALEEWWSTPITGEALHAEMQRIARRSRMPERLREIEAALDHDALLLEECFARPTLVERLSRGFFSRDERIPAADREDTGWRRWWADTSSRFDEGRARTVARPADFPDNSRLQLDFRAESPSCLPGDTWDNGSLDDVPDGRIWHTAVWTGSRMIVWGGEGASNAGGIYDPLTDSWSVASRLNAPSPRVRHVAVWTGQRMLVWGGSDVSGNDTASGGVYDPAADAWTSMSSIGAPSARESATAVWAGTRMIVWGGRDSNFTALNSGGAYDPASDAWSALPLTGGSAARWGHTAVWTGSRMLVWGGKDTAYVNLNSGAAYDPGLIQWSTLPLTNAPAPRSGHTAVWTGDRMVIWGGFSNTYLNTGGSFVPAHNAWLTATVTGAPSARNGHTAIWANGNMVIWGGYSGQGYFADGGRYDPVSNFWQPLTTLNAPVAREHHTAIWTGTRMIVWGGDFAYPASDLNSGGRYDPASDTWTPTSTGTAPAILNAPAVAARYAVPGTIP